MVGPSSSHTAGALRCAQVAASLLDSTIQSVRFTLWNSFAQTYQGHGTDRALVAGIMGFATDDKRIRDAFDIAQQQGLHYEFVIGGENSTLHPNTVDIEMTNSEGLQATVRGESLGGGKIRISRINDVSVDISGAYCTLFVAHRDVPGALAALTSLLAKAHINIAFCSTYRTEAGGQAYSVFETDQHYTAESFLSKVRSLDLVDYASFIEVPGTEPFQHSQESNPYLFTNANELLSLCQKNNLSIGSTMMRREQILTNETFCFERMRYVVQTMKEANRLPPYLSWGIYRRRSTKNQHESNKVR